MSMAIRRTAHCPSDEELAALCDGSLPHAAAEALRQHAGDCEFCTSILSEVSALRGTGPESASSRGTPARLPGVAVRWALLAAASVIAILTVGGRSTIADWKARREIAETESALRTIMAGARAIEPRLSADLPFGPLLPAYRAGSPAEVDERSLALEALALRADRAVENGRRADRLRTLAAVELTRRRYDRAVELLTEAVAGSPADLRARADLGAALLARGQSRTDRADVTRALTEIDAALGLQANDPSLRFNRALALGALARSAEERTEWTLFLQAEPKGPWAELARQSLSARAPGR